MFTNFQSSSSNYSTFAHEINPFQMGDFFSPKPLHQDPHTSTPPPNNEVTPSYFPKNSSSVLYQPVYNNHEVEALSSPKKDRHTKILTAQGVRDRRVRLSMGIAREFFDLQDMLGFDKASMTLGWLLAKSKEAIQELALEKKSLDFDGSFPFGTDEDAIGNPSSGAITRRRKRRNCSDFAREKSCCKSGSGGISHVNCNKSLVVRENREKARARARERTREKLSTTMANPVQFDHHGFQAQGSSNFSSNLLVASNPQGLNQRKLVGGGTNMIKSSHDLTNLISSTGYSQNHPIAPIGDQGFLNIFHLPNW